jgi:hypothetical protein
MAPFDGVELALPFWLLAENNLIRRQTKVTGQTLGHGQTSANRTKPGPSLQF